MTIKQDTYYGCDRLTIATEDGNHHVMEVINQPPNMVRGGGVQISVGNRTARTICLNAQEREALRRFLNEGSEQAGHTYGTTEQEQR